MIIAAGSVRTQANAMLRTVANCSPEPFAAIVPAMPDDKTCVVETGSPNPSAAAMVAAAVISAQAPCLHFVEDEEKVAPITMAKRAWV